MRDLSIAIQTPTNGGDDVVHVPGRSRTAVGALCVASASPAVSQVAFPLKTLCKWIPEKSDRHAARSVTFFPVFLGFSMEN